MKSVCRKLLALLLVLAMCSSLAASAWAAEERPQEDVTVQESGEALDPEPEDPEPEEAPQEAAQAAEEPQESEEPEDDAGEPEDDGGEPEQPARRAADEEESAGSAAEETQPESGESDKGGLLSLLPLADTLPDVEQDKNLIERGEAYVRLGKNKSISLIRQPAAEAYFVSQNEKVATVQKTGEKLVIRGAGVGRTVVEMRRAADKTLLDKLTVYAFRPTTTTRASGTNTRANPAKLTTANSAAPTRTYQLICQQKHSPGNQPYKKYLSKHGCTICASSAVCQAMGATEMTVDWLTGGGLEEIAVRSGFQLEDETLGFYGLQKVLEYGGISSKIYNWKDKSTANMEAAKEELVRSLSDGRPVLLFLDQKSKWNGIGPLCSALHCVVLVGMDSSGYVEIINSSYPHGVSRFKYGGSEHTVKLTPGELLDNFVRHSKMKRQKEDDFYFAKSGGLHTMLEVTCDKASVPRRSSINSLNVALSQTSFTYTGEAFTPTVTLGNLTENQQFRVLYANNVSAGTATVSIAGLGNYCGLRKLKFTIKRASGVITAEDKQLEFSEEEQTLNLGATARGNAPITYTSDNEAVTVNSSGVVTVCAGFAGTVRLTLRSAQTANYTAASKTVTLTVNPGEEITLRKGKISASGKSVVTKSKKQKVKLKASALGGGKLSFTCNDKKVKADASGVLTVPGSYVGVVKVTIRSEATPVYKAAKKTVQVRVLPARPALSSLKASRGGKVRVKWKKSSGAGGYQIQYWSPKDSNGKVRTVTVGKDSASVVLRKLKTGVKYQVRVRSVRKASGVTLASAWSAKKSVKTKS